jgi:hypothetical protein
MGLCAQDDILWSYFEQFKNAGSELRGAEIKGGNFGPDLDDDGIFKVLILFLCAA